MGEGERDDREYEEGEQLRMGNLWRVITCNNSIPANTVDTILFQRTDVLILSW